MSETFTAAALTHETWSDLEQLFCRPGGSIVRGCWCMYYRRSGRVLVNSSAGKDNKQQLRELAGGDTVPGLIGYLDGLPVGWISLGPRDDYLKLRRSPVMKPVDDADVWSIVCTYVDKAHRGLGLQHRLLSAAIPGAVAAEIAAAGSAVDSAIGPNGSLRQAAVSTIRPTTTRGG